MCSCAGTSADSRSNQGTSSSTLEPPPVYPFQKLQRARIRACCARGSTQPWRRRMAGCRLTVIWNMRCIRQISDTTEAALDASNTCEVMEFGAGSGLLAAQLLDALGAQCARYTIVELSGGLRARQ